MKNRFGRALIKLLVDRVIAWYNNYSILTFRVSCLQNSVSFGRGSSSKRKDLAVAGYLRLYNLGGFYHVSVFNAFHFGTLGPFSFSPLHRTF
jgi:hypothetical protein